MTNIGKCHVCHNDLVELQRMDKSEPLDNFGQCDHCGTVRESSTFFKMFGFHDWELQDDKKVLSTKGHELLWKDIAGVEKYYCTSCDSALLKTHHHHG